MTRRRRAAKIPAILATAGALPGLVTATAAPASAETHPAKAGEHCVTATTNIKHGSKVLYHGCADTAAEAQRQVHALRSCVSITLLVKFFQNLSYDGASSTWDGCSGPCDLSGYQDANLSHQNGALGTHGITSYTVHNNCKETHYWNAKNFGGASSSIHTGAVAWVGKAWNDSVLSMRTWS